MDSGSSHHMMGMRLMFLSISKTNSNYYADSGVNTMHAVKGVVCVRFLLKSRGSMEVAEVLFVLEMKISLILVSTLEDDGYGVVFPCLRVLLYPEGAPCTHQYYLVLGRGYCTGC